MLVGFALYKMAGQSYYSPEFPRQGLGAMFAVDVTNWIGGGSTPELIINVEHRNRDETSWSVILNLAVIDAIGTYSGYGVTLKEVLRYTYVFTGGVATTGAHLFVPEPQWTPY